MPRLLILAALLLLAPGAAAQEIAPFQSIALENGGEVVLVHGPAQRVTILEGAEHAEIRVIEGRLTIGHCRTGCPRGDHRLRVEVVTPALTDVAVANGGMIRAQALPASGRDHGKRDQRRRDRPARAPRRPGPGPVQPGRHHPAQRRNLARRRGRAGRADRLLGPAARAFAECATAGWSSGAGRRISIGRRPSWARASRRRFRRCRPCRLRRAYRAEKEEENGGRGKD